MRALVYTGPETVSLEETPCLPVLPGEVQIAVDYAGICGSDISGFLGHSVRRQPPLVLGHELVGHLQNGRRVVVNPLISCGQCYACLAGRQNLCSTWRLLGMDTTPGAFADFVNLPSAQVFPIPDTLPAMQAILAEPLANVIHLLALPAISSFFTLAIVGAGTMGALVLLTAKCLGAHDILAVDLNADRLRVLHECGAAATVDPTTESGKQQILQATQTGYDVVVDASGAAAARQMAFNLCRPGGKVLLLGMASQCSEIDFVTSIRKEISVLMSFAYCPKDFEHAVALLQRGEIDISNFIEQSPLELGQSAFEKITHAPGSTLKMVFALKD